MLNYYFYFLYELHIQWNEEFDENYYAQKLAKMSPNLKREASFDLKGGPQSRIHADLFCLFQAIKQSSKNSDFSNFSPRNAKIGREKCLSQNRAQF